MVGGSDDDDEPSGTRWSPPRAPWFRSQGKSGSNGVPADGNDRYDRYRPDLDRFEQHDDDPFGSFGSDSP